MKKTKYYSWKIGNLAKGCQYCVKGEKLVLFITGICPRHCYYCPISDKKYGKDVIYADEWPTSDVKDVILEAKLINAKGAGITGGDPLTRLDRTVKFIKALKKRFGKKFHIHLYTSFDLVNFKVLEGLFKAGLDEIRFHADIDNDRLWNKIGFAREFKWDIGIEIPVIPGKFKETKKLIDYFSDKIDFLNLNELEVADNKQSRLSKLGFLTKNTLSYAVKGSEEMALRLLRHIQDKRYKINVHYCTAKLKDKVQLASRIKRRAKNIARDYDIVDDEGILTRGVIYGSKKDIGKIKKRFSIPSNLIEYDNRKERILIGAWILEEIKDPLNGFKKAIVKEYPTYDQFEVTKIFI